MPISSTAADVLNREFPAMRSRLLDLAAALDRIGRAGGQAADDPRLAKFRRCLEILGGPDPDRAEQVQMVFSLPYDPHWRS